MKSGICRLRSSFTSAALLPASSSPSVNSKMPRLPPAAALNACSATRSAASRLVPPKGTVSVLSSSIYCVKASESEVSGQARYALPAKATSPKRSLGADSTSWRSRNFACSSRDGAMSVASMLFDTSKITIRSRPRGSNGTSCELQKGRAAATIRKSMVISSRKIRNRRRGGDSLTAAGSVSPLPSRARTFCFLQCDA